MNPTRIFILTLVAMIAFASNSLLCRAALKETGIDAASFTFIRILSGAVALWVIMKIRRKLMVDRTASPLVERSSGSPAMPKPREGGSLVTGHWSLRDGNWLSAMALFAYAAAFSFAYNSLTAGTGALLLFGAVQATMILWGLRKGERFRAIQIVGLVAAVSGLVVLVFPGLSAPPLSGSILMLAAGVAWGIYSLRRKISSDAIAATAGNFLRAVPFATILGVVFIPWARVDRTGIEYALLSGAIASGLGYVIWYAALAGLKATNAATVQLSVPVLAATGGILLLGEPITFRYLVASIAVLGGIALVVIEKNRTA